MENKKVKKTKQTKITELVITGILWAVAVGYFVYYVHVNKISWADSNLDTAIFIGGSIFFFMQHVMKTDLS